MPRGGLYVGPGQIMKASLKKEFYLDRTTDSTAYNVLAKEAKNVRSRNKSSEDRKQHAVRQIFFLHLTLVQHFSFKSSG